MSYDTLAQQLETIHRHARQGSIGSRRRYKAAMLRFLRFVAGTFKLQKIGNISNKHLAAYAQYLQSRGCKETYIITELAAVRYYHDQIPGRYRLTTDNAALGVGRRERCGNRAWTDEEFQRLVAIARIQSREWVADVLILGREMGNRIHEAVRLYRADAERALNAGALRIKGKGGKVRLVPLTPAAADALARARNRVPRGARLFVPPDGNADDMIREVQRFIRDHRPQRDGEQLTFHGLRYSDAQEHMRECVDAGLTLEQAERETARRLGHNRRRVVRTYTGPFPAE